MDCLISIRDFKAAVALECCNVCYGGSFDQRKVRHPKNVQHSSQPVGVDCGVALVCGEKQYYVMNNIRCLLLAWTAKCKTLVWRVITAFGYAHKHLQFVCPFWSDGI